MANQQNITGRTSELTAQAVLLRNGYTVLEPQTVEPYDIVIKEPGGSVFLKAQIKTILPRKDKNNALVIFSKKGNGERYTTDEVDVIIGVYENDVYLIPHVGQKEYWSKDKIKAKEKWCHLN